MTLGRKAPYTDIGIRRIPCAHCYKPSVHQWQICANKNRYMGVCLDCDIEINRIVGEFMHLPKTLIIAYAKRSRNDE
jgi:hypothetical protein